MARSLLVACLLVASVARADPEPPRQMTARLSLGSFVLAESDDARAPELAAASTTTLAWAELRAVLDGRRLGGSGAELRLDVRLRLTDDFSRADAVAGRAQITARGYAGGREYDLREAWVGYRGGAGEARLGRQLVVEADALRLDGARLFLHHDAGATSLHASLFAGFLPNPFSRSLLDDYVSSSIRAVPWGGGVDAGYVAADGAAWGSLALAGALARVDGDGAPVDPAHPAAPAPVGTHVERLFLAATQHLRLGPFVDLHADVVVDLASPAGVELTRATVDATLHGRRLQASLGYAHLSSLAIDLYLASLLADRRGALPGTVESNLVVERTARDEGRARVAVRPLGALWIEADARVRRRALVDPGADPAFSSVTARGAFDVTLAARDRGDLLGLRLGVALTEITDFRAETRLLAVDVGRDLAGELLSLDATLLVEATRDDGNGAPACPDPTRALAAGCFGRRAATVVEGGGTVALRPSPRWLLLGDYRLIVDDGIVTHAAFVRVDLRFGSRSGI